MADASGTVGSAEHRAVVEYLVGLRPRGSSLGIDRMRLLAHELDHPERSVPVIHVGGTNGKGSVAAMIESILRAAGWRVGLFTSPHLVDVGERVQVDRRILTPPELAAFVAELTPLADRIAATHGVNERPSFFEWMTAIAFLHFTRSACDVAVMEVGMGGEFDATNIVQPEVSVLTSVGLDHCEWLGDTVEEIARTKAGIIKPGRPVVIGRLPAGAERVVREVASRHAAPVVSVRESCGEEAGRYPATRLEGEYQRWNAATAMLAVKALPPRWRITDEAVRTGLEAVRWGGRWQRIRVGGRPVILDASHNPEGAAVLDANLARLAAETGRPPVVVVGVLGAARAGPLLAAIARHAGEIHLVVPGEPRALGHDELATHVPAGFRGKLVRSSLSGIFPEAETCAIGAGGETVVVTGSIYLMAEVMARLRLPID